MSNSSDLSKLPTRLPATVILGLADPKNPVWARLRGLQYSELASFLPIRLTIHVVAAALTVWTYFSNVEVVAMVAWLLALGGVLYYSIHCDLSLADANLRDLSRNEIRRHSQGMAALALVWSLPMAIYGWVGLDEQMLILWLVVAVLIVGSSLIIAAAPLGTMIFTIITGTTALIFSVLNGNYHVAGTIAFFVCVALFGTLESARIYLAARIAQAGITEKDEVVSLLLREFEENQADWLWKIDASRRIRGVSPRFSFALGRDVEDVEGQPLLQVLAAEEGARASKESGLQELAQKLQNKESFSNLAVRLRIDGKTRWWELSGKPIVDEQNTFRGFRGVGSDVTEQRKSSEKIAYLASYDTLTGLPNRKMVTDTLRNSLNNAQKWRSNCALLMLDLDRFKAINDTLGHLIGDKMLEQVAHRLKALTSERTLFGRLGGDEFAVVISERVSREEISDLSRNIIQSISQPYHIDHHTLHVGASIGSSIGPVDGRSVEELMRNADLALYRSKEEGGGALFEYEPSLHAKAEKRRKLESALRGAMDAGELSLAFQPVVDANDERIESFEALLRWDSETHGSVTPEVFLPLAEDTRLIVPIGKWVLEQACKEAANWPSSVRIAVNVSGEQLVEPDFNDSVVRALQLSGLEPSRLEVEVTESVFLQDADIARTVLDRVKALGCRIALDDFGTGYSSLGYLRKMSFSSIKVDRSFVQGAAQNSRESLAIVRAVVAMAQSLEMSTTAEGVENAEEVELIRKLGCTKMQGFYFGRPMTGAEATDLFAVDNPHYGASRA